MLLGLLLVLLTLALAFLLSQMKARIGPVARPPVLGEVAPFTLTNQDGAAITLADLNGRPWIADIIFTRCPGPCLRMSRQMKELQDALPQRNHTKLVTLTTDPEFDTPPILKRYAERFGADTNRWIFLTGTKKQIGEVASGSLKLSAVETKPEQRESPDDLFVHSTILVAVDKRGKLRAVFQTGGEGVDWAKEKQKVLATARELEREP